MWSELVDWFAATDDITENSLRHMYLSLSAVLMAAAVALPVGLYIGHRRRFEFIAVTFANLGRAVPSFAIVSLALIASLRLGLGLGFWPTFVALFFLSLPPILINTNIGVKGVDPDTVESARGMGFSELGILTKIELPLAAPLMVTGLRTAAVQSVATATLGALVGFEALGSYIVLGFRTGRTGPLLGGAILVGVMAIVTEISFWLLERAARPRGLGPAKRVDPILEVGQARRAPEMQPGG